MFKSFASKVVALSLAFAVAIVGAKVAQNRINSTCTINTTWQGTVDSEFKAKVEQDLAKAFSMKCELRVDLTTPGGAVFDMLEIVRQMDVYKAKGLVIEIHGRQMIASAGTIILAYGTEGRRYIAPGTFFLVHSVQGGGSCLDKNSIPKAGEKIVVRTMFGPMEVEVSEEQAGTIKFVVTEFMKALSKHSKLSEVTCANPYVGGPEVAVKIGMADAVK